MILNGWKEVANYMGRGVRTVQRWEKLGLPLHRPNTRLRSAVITTTEELDKWLAVCVTGRNAMFFEAPAAQDGIVDVRHEVARADRLMDELQQLRDASRKMRAAMSITRLRTEQLRARFHACHTAHAALQETAKSVGRVA